MKHKTPAALPASTSRHARNLVTRVREFIQNRLGALQQTDPADDMYPWSEPLEDAWLDAPADSAEELHAETPRGTCYLLLDRSGSMFGQEKLGAAKRGAADFSHESVARGYSTGLIVFDHETALLLEPTVDLAAFEHALSCVESRGGTALGKALQLAFDALDADEAPERAIVLFTDGRTADSELCLSVAHRARAEGIRIICRGTTDADRGLLARLASDEDLTTVVDDSGIAETIASAALQLPEVAGGTAQSPPPPTRSRS